MMDEQPTQADPSVDENARPVEKTVVEDPQKSIVDDLRARMDASKRTRKSRMTKWKRNVQTRLGEDSSSAYTSVLGDSDLQAEVNPDWFLTKTKTANLFSQVPVVRATHENQQFAGAVPPFLKQLNYEISAKRSNVAVCMEETLNDIVNASGIGGVRVGWAARTVDVNMAMEESFPGADGQQYPTKDLTDEQLQQLAKAGVIHLTTQKVVVDSKSFATRISPGDLLVPDEFTGSDFDEADFAGYTGRMPWAEAIVSLQPKTPNGGTGLVEGDKLAVTGGDEEATDDNLREGPAKSNDAGVQTKKVIYDDLYYWRYRFDPKEPCFTCIWRMVFVRGKSEPIIHEPWSGQELDPKTKKYVGSRRFPVQLCTITYISDNPVPPSDTEAGRPQVLDMRRSRLQMFQNRDRSIPIRWFDTSRVDVLVQNNLMRGTHQGWIPTNGDGSRSVGEIARASYPSEDFSFDQQTKQDLMELWQIGNTQMGLPESGRKNIAQVNAQQQGFATRIGQERNRVAAFFLRICEVLSGLMVLYSDFPVLTDQEKQGMVAAWDAKHITHDLVLNILPDSTVVLDSNAKIQKLVQLLNLTAKSGYVNPAPIITEIVELSGVDPSLVIVKPEPPPPTEPNLSLRLSGKEDLNNPVALAIFFKRGQPVTKDDIMAAQQLLTFAQQPAQAPPPPPGGAAPVTSPDGSPALPPPSAGGPTVTPGGEPPMGPPKEQHEDWTLPDKIMKRSRDGDAGA